MAVNELTRTAVVLAGLIGTAPRAHRTELLRLQDIIVVGIDTLPAPYINVEELKFHSGTCEPPAVADVKEPAAASVSNTTPPVPGEVTVTSALFDVFVAVTHVPSDDTPENATAPTMTEAAATPFVVIVIVAVELVVNGGPRNHISMAAVLVTPFVQEGTGVKF
jgi:hypothetical protein